MLCMFTCVYIYIYVLHTDMVTSAPRGWPRHPRRPRTGPAGNTAPREK